MTAALVEVPHAGDGSHTLVVALEVDDQVLADPSWHDAIVARVAAEARQVLDDRMHPPTVRPRLASSASGCRRCDADEAVPDTRACAVHFALEVGCRRHRRAQAACVPCRSTVGRRYRQQQKEPA